jgi:NAD(P)-dependent dehydrogenase (short-subunit alcohol dehydrogenase family)
MSAWGDGVRLLAMGAGLSLLGRWILQQRRETDLWGQVALVTGSSRGLGFLLARELTREGCKVAICGRDQAGLDAARADLEGQGAEVMAVRCDVADREQVEAMVRDVKARFGQIDILVTNAGIMRVGPVQTMTLKDFEDHMGVMFWGALYPILAVLPDMMERKSGRIVNVTSIGGKVSVPRLLPYSAAKFATVGTSEGLRAELSRHGISVTTIVPGLMRTGSHLNAYFKGDQKAEFAWFSLGASLPFPAMDAERAARQIVGAAKRGDAEVTLSLPAKALALFHGIFPGTTVEILGLVNRVLPGGSARNTEMERGFDAQQQLDSRILDTLTSLGRSAAKRFQ